MISVIFASCALEVSCLPLLTLGGEFSCVGPFVLTHMPLKRDIKFLGTLVNPGKSPAVYRVNLSDVESCAIVERRLELGVLWLGSQSTMNNLWSEMCVSDSEALEPDSKKAKFYTCTVVYATVPPFENRSEPTKITPKQLIPRKNSFQSNTGKRTSAPPSSVHDVPAKKQKTDEQSTSVALSDTPRIYSKPPTTVVDTQRSIHVVEGKGDSIDALDGTATIVLQPGEGIQELKAKIRRKFGKLPGIALGTLHPVNEDKSHGPVLKTKQLRDGMTVACHYTRTAVNTIQPVRGNNSKDDCTIF